MITISVKDVFIDIDNSTSFSISGDSPFIDPGEIPGTKVYNVSALKTKLNQVTFGFAEQLNNTNRGQEFGNVKIYLFSQLWKIGRFKLRGVSERGYKFSFHSDAADVQLQIKNRKLTQINFGTVVNDFNHTLLFPDANHVFYTVKNLDFYGNKNAEYDGYINWWNHVDQRFARNNVEGAGQNKYTVMPFPYLLFVLNGIFKDVGYYGIQGPWTEDANIRRVTVVGNFAMDLIDAVINIYEPNIEYSRYLPGNKIGAFLIDVALFFGITYDIDPVTKWVRIVTLKEWLNSPDYKEFLGRVSKEYAIHPNAYDGVCFEMQPDSKDDLLEDEPDWLNYQEGNGQHDVKVDASPLEMITEVHPVTGGIWTIPHIFQSGQGNAFGLNSDPKKGIRFMIYNGMVPDSTGVLYPQGHYLRAGFSLRWAGADGIIERCYRDWIDWKTYTEEVDLDVSMSVAELLTLDIEKKVMLKNLKYVIASYKGSISKRAGLRAVSITVFKVKN